MKHRCEWCKGNALTVLYHDKEWGVPIHNDRKLFELLILEGAQAGLSWTTILKKRENYKKAFHNFNYNIIANYTKSDIKFLMNNDGIVRNRLKIESSIKNARAFLDIIEKFESFDSYIWRYVDRIPKQNTWESITEIPITTKISDTISKDLKKYGFNFVGSTICYSFMQAIGMVNDHIVNCFRYKEVKNL